MALQIEKLTVPLETTADGTVKVRGTRIPLDTIVIAFQLGSTPQDEADRYLRERELQAERVRAENEARWPRDGIRERLMARRKRMPVRRVIDETQVIAECSVEGEWEGQASRRTCLGRNRDDKRTSPPTD